MSEHQACTYYAFVSYSHKDEKWGKWIQSALEHYRLPAVVRKEVGKPLPQKIHPVFRDDTDLGACRLEAGLQQELEQSRFLIVVCSPNSAKPNAEGKHWVNEEVKRFCDMGRTENVIPVIVEGTKETSFCPKLAEINNIGPDATKQSKARVLNNLVAKILGLRPDELWRREERRLRAKRCWRAFAASLAASLVAFGGYVWWDCTRTVTRAFADYVDSYGLPEGIFPLTDEQVARRHVHYRFEFKGYRYGKSIHADSAAPSLLRAFGFHRVLRRVVHSDSYGNAVGHDDFLFEHRPPIADFEYDGHGWLAQVLCRNGNESLHGTWNWSFLAGEGSRPSEATETFCNADGKTPVPGIVLFGEIGRSDDDVEVEDSEKGAQTISEWHIRFSPDGRTKTIAFRNAFHRPVPDEHGIVAVEIESSDSRKLWTFLPEPGKEIKSTYVRTEKTFNYGGKIRRLKGFYSGRSFDNPAKSSWDFDRLGFSGILRESIDEDTIRTTFLDLNGAPKWNMLRWWTFRDQTFRDGNMVSVRFDSPEDVRGGIMTPRLEDDDDASYANDPPRFYRMAVGHLSAYDASGAETNRVFIDRNGQPILSEDGYAGFSLQVDSKGRTTKKVFLGQDGQPIDLEKGGHCGWARTFDAKHRVKSFWYVGRDGLPFLNHREFFAGWEKDYDDVGNVLSLRFFGKDRRPILLPDGFASWMAAYDEAGNETNTVWCGKDGKPLLQPEGFAARARAFDGSGNNTNTVYLGEDMAPLRQSAGFAGFSTRFDENGRAVEQSFFDECGNPVIRDGGYAAWRKAYDETGAETNRVYRGANGELVLVSDNEFGQTIGPVAGWWKRFGPKGDMIAAGTIGTNGLPLMNAKGWATWRIENGEEYWFDADGKPIRQTGIGSKTSWDGPSVKTTWYFDRGTAKPTANLNGAFGEREWLNEFGEVTNRLFLAVDESPVVTKAGHAGISYEYNVFGGKRKLTKTTWYGTDFAPVFSKDWNCAVHETTYDDWGLDTAEIYYDAKGNLIEKYSEEGAAYKLYEMLHRPQTYTETKMTFIGTNGCPVLGKKSGYAWLTHHYSDNQLTTTNRFFGPEGNRILLEGGYSGTILSKDHHRNITNIVYLGFSDSPAINSEFGYAARARTYDYSWGNDEKKRKMTSESYYDITGNLIAKKTGEAGWRDKFDDYGRQIERTYFGTNGLPVMTKYGFATRQMFYDETTGVETNRVMLDADGTVIQPKTMEKKKYSWKPHYDEAGSLIKETYESEDGTLGRDSLWSKASSIEYQYDSNGMETNRVYRGIHGEPILCDRWPVNKNSTPGRYWRGEEGYFELRQTYDAQGRLAEKSFWNTNGMAMLCSVGVHIMRYEYDEAGRVIEIRNFGVDGLPCADREGVHVERRIFSEDGKWVDTTRTAPDGTTRLCKWATKVVKTVAPDSFAERLGAHPGDRWVRLGDHIFAEAFLSTNNSDGLVSFVQWEERMRQSSIDPNWVSILAKKAGDDFIIVAFSSKELTLSALGFENEHDKTRPMEQEGATLLTRAVEWLKTSTPEAISVDDRNGN